MKKPTIQLLTLIFCYAAIIGFGTLMLATFTDLHEAAHEQVAKQHGCINGTKITKIGAGSYQCNEYLERSEEWALQERALQSLTEIIGYHLKILIYGAYALLVIIIILNDTKEIRTGR